jgi:hypothetical protein
MLINILSIFLLSSTLTFSSVTTEKILSQKKWKAIPNTEIALAQKGKKHFLIILNEKEKTTRARAEIISEENCNDPENDCKDFSLDLAPYKVTSDLTAIGVRWKQYSEYPAGESNSKILQLFLLKDTTLIKIFESTMELSATQRGPGELLTKKCILNISEKKTKEHFDLEKVCTKKVEALLENINASKIPPIINKETTRYVWDGNKYIK